MFNGDLIKTASSKGNGSFLSNLANDAELNSTEKINHLFLAALSRKPSTNEIKVANQLLLARKGELVAALQDIWWAILNSNEFILNH